MGKAEEQCAFTPDRSLDWHTEASYGEEQKMGKNSNAGGIHVIMKNNKWRRQKNGALSRLIGHSIGTRRRLITQCQEAGRSKSVAKCQNRPEMVGHKQQ